MLLEQLDSTLAAHAETRMRQLQQTLERERAETIHQLAEQERGLREERRIASERQADEASLLLTETVTASQQRLEHRLSAWSSDLERAQQQLKTRLEELIRKQADALQGHESRLAQHAAEVEALEEAQNIAMGRVRPELERSIQEALVSASLEIEAHAAERRRALHEVSDRLRARERAMREQVEREEGEVRTQLTQVIDEVERRHVEQLARLLDRAVLRLSEDAERRFDQQLRESREKTAARLARELELSMDTFTKTAEKEVAARIAEAAQASAQRLQRQIDDVVRAAEVQTGISNERIHALTERLEKSLEAAHDRLSEFEANVELELATKLREMERALRAAEQRSAAP
jgi:gas vesicle protein